MSEMVDYDPGTGAHLSICKTPFNKDSLVNALGRVISGDMDSLAAKTAASAQAALAAQADAQLSAQSAQKSAQAVAGAEASTEYDANRAGVSALAAEKAAALAQAEADRATVPAVQGFYNIILQDRVTGKRYALVAEAGVLALLGVSPKLDAVELTIVDSADGRAYALAVEGGNLLLEEVS